MVKHFFDRLQMHSQFLVYVYLYCAARWLLFATIEEEPMHLFFFLRGGSINLLLDGQLYMTDRLAPSIPGRYCLSCSIHIDNHKNTFLPSLNALITFFSPPLSYRSSSDQSILSLSVFIRRNRRMHRSIRRGSFSIPYSGLPCSRRIHRIHKMRRIHRMRRGMSPVRFIHLMMRVRGVRHLIIQGMGGWWW